MMSMWGMHITVGDDEGRGVSDAICGCLSRLSSEKRWMDSPGIEWRGCIGKDELKARVDRRVLERSRAVKAGNAARWQDYQE